MIQYNSDTKLFSVLPTDYPSDYAVVTKHKFNGDIFLNDLTSYGKVGNEAVAIVNLTEIDIPDEAYDKYYEGGSTYFHDSDGEWVEDLDGQGLNYLSEYHRNPNEFLNKVKSEMEHRNRNQQYSNRTFSEGQFDAWMKQMKYPGDALRGMIRDIRRYPGYDRELMLKLLSSELHRVLVFSKDLILRNPIDMSRVSKMLKLNQKGSEELQKSSDKFTKDCKKAIAKDSHKEFNTAINNFATVLISLV